MTGPINERPRGRSKFRILTAVFVAGLLMIGVTALVLESTAKPASAALIPINQCNGVLATPGTVTVCRVTVINNLTDDPLTTNSIVTVTDFTGATTITPSADIVTSVTQCNGVGMDGSTVQCYVDITNNITTNGASAPTAVTVNQCQANQPIDGLGNDLVNTCSPGAANTTGAVITQCNGTGNGGGLVTVVPDFSHCIATGTMSASLIVTVNQCNGSVNGGNSQVDCRVSMSNNVVNTAVAVPTAVPTVGSPLNLDGTTGPFLDGSGTFGRVTATGFVTGPDRPPVIAIVGTPNTTG